VNVAILLSSRNLAIAVIAALAILLSAALVTHSVPGDYPDISAAIANAVSGKELKLTDRYTGMPTLDAGSGRGIEIADANVTAEPWFDSTPTPGPINVDRGARRESPIIDRELMPVVREAGIGVPTIDAASGTDIEVRTVNVTAEPLPTSTPTPTPIVRGTGMVLPTLQATSGTDITIAEVSVTTGPWPTITPAPSPIGTATAAASPTPKPTPGMGWLIGVATLALTCTVLIEIKK
jgi:hypothetical protein